GDSVDIYQEGLQFPGIKLFNQGRLNQSVVEIIRYNVRYPDSSLGDMWAQIAALRLGNNRFLELCKQQGRGKVLASIDLLLSNGEKVAKNELKKLPKGTFNAESIIDD